MQFNPPDIYNKNCPSTEVTYNNILDDIRAHRKPQEEDVLCYIKGWFNLHHCARYNSTYFPSHFGQIGCIESGKPRYIIISAVKKNNNSISTFGVHLLCFSCYKRYFSQIKEKVTEKSNDTFETSNRIIYVYRL